MCAQGPTVDVYSCHAPGGKDYDNQRFERSGALATRTAGDARRLQSVSASAPLCLSLKEVKINDCGTALWFPDDVHTDGVHAGRAHAVATFGELRGGNISLVSSTDLENWEDHGPLLQTRPDKWDNATLSSGPAPVRLSDGSWLLLYNVDNLWPVDNPKPLPAFGRCGAPDSEHLDAGIVVGW